MPQAPPTGAAFQGSSGRGRFRQGATLSPLLDDRVEHWDEREGEGCGAAQHAAEQIGMVPESREGKESWTQTAAQGP